MKRYVVLLAIAALVVAGCATSYRPPIDPTFATDSARLQKDLFECDQIARSASPDAGSKAVEKGAVGAVGGAATGAALGAITGAFSGKAGTGAAIGAATGGLLGATGGAIFGGTAAQSQYEAAYDACMRNRGYKLLK
ncbi:MAG: glycine zipper family protein [Candidatus Methylomirabilales bacterium]